MRELGRPRRPWDKTPLPERDYFEILGPGLIAVLPPRRAGSGGESGWSPATGGAWVHVGADGRVCAFTGKAEVGQGTRTALSLVVAEELGVPLERVDLVMADTDLCPWDMGTFGSRSMPDAASSLAATAAGAREALLGEAARRTGADARKLVARDGAVGVPNDRKGTSYGELVAGLHRVETVRAGTSPTPPAHWERAGRAVGNPESLSVVTGSRQFVSDLRRPGMLHGAILGAPRYGAHLRKVDLKTGRGRSGVTLVREGDFVGAAARTSREARAELAGLTPEWEGPPQPGEHEIEPYLRAHPSTGDAWDVDDDTEGDVGSALSRSAVKVEATYRTSYIAHVPLETHCALAEWEGPRVTVWVGSQVPFGVRDEVAETLGVDAADVRVIVPPTGAGFGGKHGGELAIAAARLARAAEHPVRVAFTREEEFRYAY
ncbi:MAG: molybdopterin-dependent oxidoreductase, partial [Thermoplasmata archaeon]|nr:molybdopterin-dependent oxidoreductase [Thermoplasmata archaeon]